MADWKFWRWGRKSAGDGTLELFRELYGSRLSKAGIAITPEVALQCTVALACARVIAQGLSQIPFRLMRTDGVTRTAATGELLYTLLEDAPNRWQTAPEFWDMVGLHLALCDNAYIWKIRVGRAIEELIPITPGMVRPERVGNFDVRYHVTLDDGTQRVLGREDVWHLRGLSWSTLAGLGAASLARDAIGLALATEEHATNSFSDGVVMRGVLSTAASLNQEQREQNRKNFVSALRGDTATDERERIGIAVLGGAEYKFQPLVSPNDVAQLIENRKFQIEEICRGFGVMPIMVGYSDKASTYASAEQMFLAHLIHTMGPWYRRLEKSATVRLLSREQRADGLYFKFFTNAMLRGSVKDRADFYTKLYNVGALNPNEIRELEDMNPYDGGDQFRVPLNMVDPTDPDPEGTEDDGTPKSEPVGTEV